MSNTMWMERQAGDGPAFGETRVDTVPGEPGVLLISDGVPDWIRDPITGAKVRVEGTEMHRRMDCPHCKQSIGDVRVVVAERDGFPEQQLLVYECPLERKFIVASRDRPPPPAPQETEPTPQPQDPQTT